MQRIGKHNAATLLSRIADGTLTVAGNHPFAGQTVTLHVRRLRSREAIMAGRC